MVEALYQPAEFISFQANSGTLLIPDLNPDVAETPNVQIPIIAPTGKDSFFVPEGADVLPAGFVFESERSASSQETARRLRDVPTGSHPYVGADGHIYMAEIVSTETFLVNDTPTSETLNPFSLTVFYAATYDVAKQHKGQFEQRGWTGPETRGIVRKEQFPNGQIGTTFLDGLQMQAGFKDYNAIKAKEESLRSPQKQPEQAIRETFIPPNKWTYVYNPENRRERPSDLLPYKKNRVRDISSRTGLVAA